MATPAEQAEQAVAVADSWTDLARKANDDGDLDGVLQFGSLALIACVDAGRKLIAIGDFRSGVGFMVAATLWASAIDSTKRLADLVPGGRIDPRWDDDPDAGPSGPTYH